MFNLFRAKKAEVLDHWIAFIDGFSLVPSEFYESVEQELKAREVPGMGMSRVEFSEGGVLSEKRVYLRLIRERLVFDICAAPFGKSFFFSCRMAEIPSVIHVWQVLVIYFTSNLVIALVWRFAGFVNGTSLLVLGFFLLVYVLRNAVAMGLKDLDAALIKFPVIGSVYERLFRAETYHRVDTRLLYLQIVSSVVRRLADDAVASKGVKLVPQYELAPILGELYKPVAPVPK